MDLKSEYFNNNMDSDETGIRLGQEKYEGKKPYEKTGKEEISLPINVVTPENLKMKYGDIYEISITLDSDDEDDGRTLTYIFKRPTNASFTRYIKNASKNIVPASKTFVMDNIIDEHQKGLEKECNVYPGLAMNISTKFLNMLGLGDGINFKKL